MDTSTEHVQEYERTLAFVFQGHMKHGCVYMTMRKLLTLQIGLKEPTSSHYYNESGIWDQVDRTHAGYNKVAIWNHVDRAHAGITILVCIDMERHQVCYNQLQKVDHADDTYQMRSDDTLTCVDEKNYPNL